MSEKQTLQDNGAGSTAAAVSTELPPENGPDEHAFWSRYDLSENDDDGSNFAPANDEQAVFDEILHRLQANNIDLTTFEQRQQFVQRYGPYLKPKEQRGVTILHAIALAQGLEGKAGPLIRLLVKEYPGLMESQDKHGRSALHLALAVKKYPLVTAMLEAFEDIDAALGIQDDDGKNGLHAAITSMCPSQLLLTLIQKASEHTLCCQDRAGLTPLHAAVSFRRCTPRS
jgi:hypothetical protein